MDLRRMMASGVLGATLVLGSCTGVGVAAEPPREPRSVDPVCPWGRLADGKGRLLRCLAQEEVARLREAPPLAPATAPPRPAANGVSSAPPAPPPTSPPRSAQQPGPVSAAPSPAASAPAAPLVPADPVPPGADPAPAGDVSGAPPGSSVSVELGPIVADAGALPEAIKSLKKGADRIAECVDQNGGLTEPRAVVEVRFLVQGRGRAEGVSVKSRRGVSEAAARCVASVVDRRYVGFPEAPVVGATLVVSMSKKKK